MAPECECGRSCPAVFVDCCRVIVPLCELRVTGDAGEPVRVVHRAGCR